MGVRKGRDEKRGDKDRKREDIKRRKLQRKYPHPKQKISLPSHLSTAHPNIPTTSLGANKEGILERFERTSIQRKVAFVYPEG
jgi:hypothetical protein